VVLFLSHSPSSKIVREFQKIYCASKERADSFLLFHDKSGFPRPQTQLPVKTFTDSQLSQLNFKMLGRKIVPGNAHFPLLYFFSQFPDYDFYWLIEYDVRFSGSWKYFFSKSNDSDADFLACQIRTFQNDPDWFWWFSLEHPAKNLPLGQRVRSFNPVYRISKKALHYLCDCHADGWSGHFEVLAASMFFNAGFRIADFGGIGEFVEKNKRNQSYIDGEKGTIRWRPAFSRVGLRRNKLYHPVK
jgi:hypothetical protein